MPKPLAKLLIANRGEIAIRIARAADELGIATLAVCSEDDASSLHTRKASACHTLRGRGARAYLDIEQLLEAAKRHGCDAVHPGYGFLSESAAFARACDDAGLRFVGPTAAQLLLFGDKLQARKLAERLGVPTPRGSGRLTSAEEAAAFFTSLAGTPAIVKAAMGGGGRGMRVVRHEGDVFEAFERCQSEAKAAFGDEAVYMEELIADARHVEAQIVGDGRGGLRVLGERECSLQRRHQKLVEIAPSPSLGDEVRERILAAAHAMASDAGYRSLGTFEFLYGRGHERFVFIEANPRLQVEHTITEQVFGVDLVQAQLRIAAGETLDAIGLGAATSLAPRGYAIELRVNLERVSPDGQLGSADGTVTVHEMPSGPGVRVDGAGYVGYAPNPSFDSLLAKVIVHAPSGRYEDAVKKARRALAELQLEGVPSNVPLLKALLAHPAFLENDVSTTFLETHMTELLSSMSVALPEAAQAASVAAPANVIAVRAPLRGRIVSFDVVEHARVRAGQQLGVIEAMKMESAVLAPRAGIVQRLLARPGDSVQQGETLAWLEPAEESEHDALLGAEDTDGSTRADLQELAARHARLLDAARPKAVDKRRQTKQRTTRENIADLCDEGSFVEYGGLAIAAQRRTRTVEELLEVSPADGLVSGIGTINAQRFGKEQARAMVIAYDYTVFAGTQGMINHKKQDRMFQLARDRRLPLVLYAEGGGGRPGDTDFQLRPMLDLHTFRTFAELSGLVPLVGVVSGRCFAGNAVLLGCCDVIIATEDSSVGLAGPVMIEGAGLGRFSPEEVGPIDVQAKNGVVDVRVPDEAAATAVAKQYLSYFQGRTSGWQAPDVTRLRALVPENRMRVYDMRELIATIADVGSVLELRREFGTGMITALVRIEGRPCGVIANEPSYLAGAIDAEAGDKASRFMRLCNAFGLPIVSLCDTPGFMVGPDAEKTALVRRCTRMMVTAADLEVPLLCVIVRKAYGLGAMAMAGGSLHAPLLTVAWPTGELGAMGLEGAVLLAIRKQLEAIADPEERKRTVKSVVEMLREQGKAVNVATHVELDDVIDPAETRHCLVRALESAGVIEPRAKRGRAFIDTW